MEFVDLDDILFSVINTEQYGFSLELSEYARKQFDISSNRGHYTEALGILTYSTGQIHLRIYKFRTKKGINTYKKFKYNYYIDWVK